ncbi:bifunctional metallophosphatase/5'-nucleotidase [candidate division KSB1 bacterium]|nr:bifunctional metallophosphatase/5'-nucleotidase [candidate division KSB1 bacterium]NIR70472.1 bifunctional metallophosphatase/5'-nucleotidase [candidate division KSB1 bacterium]NIS23202.1 bifunctional metallophosphatase/5'-nucleotidase [candidate division KSB1 bacterium]NIT70062.1 bifunctional metallophosphatase/5'-nucleotidase [candidate division KSB1 bacterium]NIU23699.1 bifunctional metallophosphatase/5'-nucleotidase [candidate division KSB1 bacterium]
MKKMLVRILCLVFGVALFLGSELHAQTVTLKFVETSDVHGAIFPYDFINDQASATSLAQVHAYVQREKRKDQEVILLDGGDLLQGQPVVYYYNFEKPDAPHIMAEVLNYMRYEAGTVGNHDVEAGHPVYDKFVDELNFPWLAANAVDTETGDPYFPPYTVLKKRGVRIAILGLITPRIPHWLPEKIWEGMEFQDMVETAKKWVRIIQEQEGPDLLIGLFHAGVDYTYGGVTAETPRNENASRLVAEQVPGFDIVFVGHDHVGWNLVVQNLKQEDIYILGPRSGAVNVAVATIEMSFDEATHSWKKNIIGELVDMKNVAPDSAFMDTFSYALKEVKEYVSQPIGTFTQTISTRDALFGNSAFVDLIHKIQLELSGADISFAAPLSFDASIEKGTVYVRDMFKLYRYENFLYTMDMTGQEIKDMLEYSCKRWFNRMNDANDHLLNFQRDENGNLVKSARYDSYQLSARSYNFDSAAGINYTVDVSKPSGESVTIHSMSDGTAFDLNRTYAVAINSYRGNGGGGHLTRGAKIPKSELSNRVMNSTEKDLRYFMMKWIEEQEVVTPEPLGNWKIIPEDWWKAAKARDYNLLFSD